MKVQKPSGRKLNHNKRTVTPKLFVFVDTETLLDRNDPNVIKHSFRLGVAWFVRYRSETDNPTITKLRFTDISDFWDKLDGFVKGKNTVHLIAHNAFFDSTILQHITHLEERGFECRFIFEDGVTFIANWANDQRKVMILDNANWFKGKLETWGETLGIEKLPMPEFSDSDDKWFVYCDRDVEILYRLQQWFLDFIQDNDLGTWKYTIASCSLNSYRHRFMPHPIYIPEKSGETDLARKAYKGGRTEGFYYGEANDGPFYKLDINSMYPFVMADNLYPTCVEGYADNPTIDSVASYVKRGGVVAKCRVNVNKPYFPYFDGERIIYPIGQFDTVLFTPEVKLCIDQGWLESIESVGLYRMRPIFKEFVDFFYGERMRYKERGDVLRVALFKLFLNSLYGKFGQRKFKDVVIGQAEPGTFNVSYGKNVVTGATYLYRQIGRNVIRSEKGGEGHNAFVGIAGHVTAYARIYLYSCIERAGRANVYYTDTDSLIVGQLGYDNLSSTLDNKALGALKCEGVADSIAIVAPKHYRFGEKWTIKGVRKNAEKIGEDTYRQEVWPGVNRILQQGEETYYNYFVTKRLSAKVASGNIDGQGFVHPFELMEGNRVN